MDNGNKTIHAVLGRISLQQSITKQPPYKIHPRQWQVFVKSHKNKEGITLKPTQKSATASETINALVLVRRFRLLQTRKIVNPFPVIARNERTQPRIQNQVSILTVKGSSY